MLWSLRTFFGVQLTVFAPTALGLSNQNMPASVLQPLANEDTVAKRPGSVLPGGGFNK